MSIYLRAANKDDMHLLWEWANDLCVRQNSFNSSHISLEDHKGWFDRVLKDSNKYLYILCDNDERVGQIRLDKQEDGSAIINYSISNQYRGNGYGRVIIQLANNIILSDSLPITSLIAKVKKDNVASQLIFEQCGYSISSITDFYEYKKTVLNAVNISDLEGGGDTF